jgi:hypothetical protein
MDLLPPTLLSSFVLRLDFPAPQPGMRVVTAVRTCQGSALEHDRVHYITRTSTLQTSLSPTTVSALLCRTDAPTRHPRGHSRAALLLAPCPGISPFTCSEPPRNITMQFYGTAPGESASSLLEHSVRLHVLQQS